MPESTPTPTAATPLEVVGSEVIAKDLARRVVEEVPGGHQIEGRIGRPEAAHVDDPYQASSRYQDVARSQVAVRPSVGRRSG